MTARFKPKTVYVTYIASTPEKVWDALTQPEFTKQYFFGRTIEIEPKKGGAFILRMPDGRVDVKGHVVNGRRRVVSRSRGWSTGSRTCAICPNAW